MKIDESVKMKLTLLLMENNCRLDLYDTSILANVILDYIKNEAKDPREVLNKILSTRVYYKEGLIGAGECVLKADISNTLKLSNEIRLNKSIINYPFVTNGVITHEFGHFTSGGFEYNAPFLIVKYGVRIQKLRIMGDSFIIESDCHKGLNEAINSLRTKDRLLRMGREGHAGYEIARELLSRIRTHYNISQEIVEAETTHDASLISRAIKNKANSEAIRTLPEDELLNLLDNTFDFIVKEYFIMGKNSHSKMLSKANELVKVLELDDAPFEAKELYLAMDNENTIEIELRDDLGLEL